MKNKPTISNIILVEGEHDKSKILSLFNCFVIVSNGYDFSKVIPFLKIAEKIRKIIILTDNDLAGDEIRDKIHCELVNYEDVVIKARSPKHNKTGVAECESCDIYGSLKAYITTDTNGHYNRQILYRKNLLGSKESKTKRIKICNKYSIISPNIEVFINSLNYLNVKESELC